MRINMCQFTPQCLKCLNLMLLWSPFWIWWAQRSIPHNPRQYEGKLTHLSLLLTSCLAMLEQCWEIYDIMDPSLYYFMCNSQIVNLSCVSLAKFCRCHSTGVQGHAGLGNKDAIEISGLACRTLSQSWLRSVCSSLCLFFAASTSFRALHFEVQLWTIKAHSDLTWNNRSS